MHPHARRHGARHRGRGSNVPSSSTPQTASCARSPRSGGYLPVSFCIDEDFLIAPPPGIALYHRNGKGCALYASGFCRADQSLNVLQKAEVSGARLTLFRQGKLFLEIAEEGGMHLCVLPDELENCSFFAQDDGFLLAGGGGFALLSRQGEILVAGGGARLETGGVLRAEVPFHDSRGHTALCEWQKGELLSCTVRTARAPHPRHLRARPLRERALRPRRLPLPLPRARSGRAQRVFGESSAPS